MNRKAPGKMRPCGKAADSCLIFLHMKCFRVFPDKCNSAGEILEGLKLKRNPVCQIRGIRHDKCVIASCIEFQCDKFALRRRCHSVTAARHDNYCRPGRVIFLMEIPVNGRNEISLHRIGILLFRP
jgi:hypothetical protein